MNERIKELAEQAGLGQERWNTTEQFNSFLAKFAELIVQECAKACEDHPGWSGRMIGEQIKEHFGVEP
jgi:hypothetical protein